MKKFFNIFEMKINLGQILIAIAIILAALILYKGCVYATERICPYLYEIGWSIRRS